jgi:fluoroquinolone resistance protein
MMLTTVPESISQQTLGRAELLSLLAGSEARGATQCFEHCDFDGADLSRLDLRGAQFMACSFAEATFERALLADTRWLACKARQANFHLADLSDARFGRCDLNNSGWARAKLASTLFTEVKLTGAQFGGVQQSLGLSFHDSLLVGADLRGLSFRKQLIERLDLSDADLAGCDFRDAVFEGGSLRDAHLKNARFDGADLRSVDLGGLRIGNLAQCFKGAIISAEQAAALVGELGVRVI